MRRSLSARDFSPGSDEATSRKVHYIIAAGVDIRTVAGRLGHGSGADTMATIVPKPVPAPAAPRGP